MENNVIEVDFKNPQNNEEIEVSQENFDSQPQEVESDFELHEVVTHEGDQLEVEEVSPSEGFLEKMHTVEQGEKDAQELARQAEDPEEKVQILEQSAKNTRAHAEIYAQASALLRSVVEEALYKVNPSTIAQESYIEGRIGDLNYAVTPEKALQIKQTFQENGYIVREKPDVGFLVEIKAEQNQELVMFLEVEI